MTLPNDDDLRAILAAATPGPWTKPLHFATSVEDPTGRGICSTGGYSDNRGGTYEANVSNADLITLAPDLAQAFLYRGADISRLIMHLADTEALEMQHGAVVERQAAEIARLRAALVSIILLNRLRGLTTDSGERKVWRDGPCGTVARAALEAK